MCYHDSSIEETDDVMLIFLNPHVNASPVRVHVWEGQYNVLENCSEVPFSVSPNANGVVEQKQQTILQAFIFVEEIRCCVLWVSHRRVSKNTLLSWNSG